ncbi:MAG: hypothetical protein RIS86_604 [Planctomycetota bacterium]|jgi:hypothetical protein
MATIAFGDATLTRVGTIVTCNIGGRDWARMNLVFLEPSEDVPLTLFLADRKFEFTLEQTRAFLEGMPKPEPREEAAVVEAAADSGVAESEAPPAAEEAPKKRTRRSSTTA